MNPILRQIQQSKIRQQTSHPANPNINQLIADIQSGKIDPKQEVMQRMTNLNPVQRLALQAAMPMLGKVGKKFGATDDDIQAIKQALHF